MFTSSLSFFRLTAWLYVGALIVAGGSALFGLCADLMEIAMQLVKTFVGQVPL